MRVKLLQSVAGPTGAHRPGDVIEVTDRAARRMVAAGVAAVEAAEANTAPDLLTTTAAEPRETTSAAPKRARRSRKG